MQLSSQLVNRMSFLKFKKTALVLHILFITLKCFNLKSYEQEGQESEQTVNKDIQSANDSCLPWKYKKAEYNSSCVCVETVSITT